MKIFTFLLFLIVCFFAFMLINRFAMRTLAYEIEKRYLHFRTILAGALVTVIFGNAYTSSKALVTVDEIINSDIGKWLLEKVLPERAYELIYMVLCIIGMNLYYSLLVIAAAFIAKIFFRKRKRFIIYSQCGGSERFFHFPWSIVNMFYKPSDNKYRLIPKGYVIGIWVRGMKRVSAVIMAGEMLLLYASILWGTESWNEKMLELSKSFYMLPMIIFLISGQVQLFFEGPESGEAGTFATENIDEKMTGEMYGLQYRYCEMFRDHDMLIYSEKGSLSSMERQGLESNDIGNRQIMDCTEPGILSVITNRLKTSGIQQNNNYQNAVISLLNGRSVTIRDCLDGEFMVYLCAYLNHFLFQGRSALILCPDKVSAERIRRSAEEKMNLINSLDSVWNIFTMDSINTTGHISIMICTYEEFINTSLINRYSRFASDLFCTVIASADTLLSRDSLCLEMLFCKFRSFPAMKQFVFTTAEDNEFLRAKMKTLTAANIRILPFSNDVQKTKTGIMVWKEESCCRPQQVLGIGNAQSPYMGTALPLSLVAAHFDLPQINIVPSRSSGDRYFYTSAMPSNERDVKKYLEKSLDLSTIIRYSHTEALADRDLKMLVIYDSDCNFCAALWKWMKYGGKDGTLIHVISPFYMMREYLAANFRSKKLLYSNNEFSALIPDRAILKHSRLTALLAVLSEEKGMTEDEIMAVSDKYGWHYKDVTALLKAALQTIRPDNAIHNVYEHFKFTEDKPFRGAKGFDRKTRITLTDQNILRLLHEHTALANMSYQNGSSYTELPLLTGNILNYFLPEQIVVFDGSFYRIESVSGGVVHTAPTRLADMPDYYTISDFVFKDYYIVDNCVDMRLLDVNVCEAEVTRCFYGYVSCSHGNDFHTNGTASVKKLTKTDRFGTKVTLEHIPILEINIPKDSFPNSDTAEKACTLLAVIMNGLFRTLFPGCYQNLFVFPDKSTDAAMINRILNDSGGYSFEELVSSVIPRVRNGISSESSKYIRIYVVEFSCVEYGMVSMVYHELEGILNKVYKYLNWYIASNKAYDAEKEKSERRFEEEDAPAAEEATEPEEAAASGYADAAASDMAQIYTQEPAPEEEDSAAVESGEETPQEELPAESISGKAPKKNKQTAPAEPVKAPEPKPEEPREEKRGTILRGRYLHFGAERMPSLFAPKALLEFLEKILRNPEPEPVIECEPDVLYDKPAGIKTTCSFCERETIFGWQLSNGRYMCAHCHDHQKTQEEEIRTLFREVMEVMENHYQIKFRKDINVRFQSAKTIQKVSGISDADRFVGFYNHDKHQLWIESRGPAVALECTIIHELTHAWQYDNLPIKEFLKSMPRRTRNTQARIVLEGHAVYVELEAMEQKGEAEFAKRLKKSYVSRDDVYSFGYRFVSDYINTLKLQGSHITSFTAIQRLVDDVIKKEVKVPWQKDLH